MDLKENVITAIITGVIASFVYEIIKYLNLKIKFKKYIYNVYNNKTFIAQLKDNNLVEKYIVNLKVKENCIIYNGKTNDNNEFNGEIYINPIDFKTGEGHHTHVNENAFGFNKAILKNHDTIYLETVYSKNNQSIHQAYVWKIINTNQ